MAAIRMTLLAGSLVALFTVANAASTGAADWTAVPLGTTEDILAVEPSSFSPAYVVGTNGLAMGSDVSRTTWSVINVGTTADLLSFLQPALGQQWFGAGGGTVRILYAGLWYTRSLPITSQDFVLFTRNSGQAYAVGTGGDIYRTLNGGVNWEHQYSGTAALHDGSGSTTGLAWAVGDNGTILKTTNGGVLWTAVSSGTSADLYSISADGTMMVAVGEGGAIVRTSNGGATWTPVASPTTKTLRAIGGGALAMIAAGDDGTVIKSTDDGVSWCRLETGTTVDLRGCAVSTASEYFVGGDGGVLLRTTTGGGSCASLTSVIESPHTRDDECFLAGPTPNPLRGAGRIELAVNREQTVRVDLLDVTGRLTRSLLHAQLASGSTRIFDLDSSGLVPGVYFLRVEGESFCTMRRVVVAK